VIVVVAQSMTTFKTPFPSTNPVSSVTTDRTKNGHLEAGGLFIGLQGQ